MLTIFFSSLFRITDIPSTPSVIKLVEPPKKLHLDTLVEEKINAALQNTTKSKKHSTKKVTTDIQEPAALIVPPPTPEPKHSTDPVLEILPKDGAASTPNTYNTDPGGAAEEVVLLVTPPPEVDGTTVAPSVDKSPELNLTAEERPIPVFSEWAQKQLEEAEKKLEEEKVNISTQKKSNAVSQKPQNGKVQTSMKLRAKNYASPDCGAKIIATNPDAQSTGAVLTSHRDEYLLSPCTSRIWFVVELCEAIQAESIELANFELFSSSPKDFVVSVGARFPTRDWSTVGQFTAKDERDVQSFQLHPHLFGKYVRVEVNSHYNSEHYCPISLFRVYGTSEMEAFETENQPQVAEGFDDDEDDPVAAKKLEGDAKKNNGILKSAGEAVMNIVKKAAEALGKGGQNQTDAGSAANQFEKFAHRRCTSLAYDTVCHACTADQSAELYTLLSCHMPALSSLLARFRANLYESQQCAKLLGFNLGVNKFLRPSASSVQLFLERVVAHRYLVAMCNLLAIEEKKVPMNTSCASATTGQALHLDNQTIDGAGDKKSGPAKLVSAVGQTTTTFASTEPSQVGGEGEKKVVEVTTPAVSSDANSLETQLPPTPVETGAPGSSQVLITTTTPTSSSVEVVTDASVKVNGKAAEAVEAKKGEAVLPSTPQEDVNIFNIVTDGSHEVESKPVTGE
jgi:Sad1 / UNC-like C-terminal